MSKEITRYLGVDRPNPYGSLVLYSDHVQELETREDFIMKVINDRIKTVTSEIGRIDEYVCGMNDIEETVKQALKGRR